MKEPLTFAKLGEQVKKLFWLWLVIAVVAGCAVLVYNHYTMPIRNKMTATVNFSFDGIEQGMDPAGNRFNAEELKEPEVLRAAAEAIGLSVSEADIQNISDHITLLGIVPEDAISRITAHTSVYANDNISVLSAAKSNAYYPSQFTVTFDYRAAGFSDAQGNQLFSAVLKAYETFLYTRYGYSTTMEQAVLSFDYSEYDFDKAIEVIDNELEMLNGYVGYLAGQDSTRFRSTATGYAFADLESAIQTLRTEDLNLISSYVSSNNITRSWQEQIDYYNYKIEQEEREKASLEERINTLTALIDSYAKTKAVVMGSSASDSMAEESSVYQITQQSDMYDSLIQQRISLQTESSETQEQINLYKQRMARIVGNSSDEDIAYVEEQLEAILNKAKKLLTAVNETASEYFAAVKLQRAVQVIETTDGSKFSIARLIRFSLGDGVCVVAIIFGLFLLIALLRAQKTAKRGKKFLQPAAKNA